MTEMFGEAWSPMSVPDLAPDDDEFINAKLELALDLTILLLKEWNDMLPIQIII